MRPDELGEGRVAGRAVAVAEDDVGARLAGAAFALDAADRVHRVAVDVPAGAELRMRRLDPLGQRVVVGAVIALDPPVDLLDAEPPRVDRRAVVERAPDQGLAEPGLAARQVLVRPLPAFDQLEVDVAGCRL